MKTLFVEIWKPVWRQEKELQAVTFSKHGNIKLRLVKGYMNAEKREPLLKSPVKVIQAVIPIRTSQNNNVGFALHNYMMTNKKFKWFLLSKRC